MKHATLITTRRNFLVRATAFTAGGVGLSVPIVTQATAADRIAYHQRQLDLAFRDLYPEPVFFVNGYDNRNESPGYDCSPEGLIRRSKDSGPAIFMICAKLSQDYLDGKVKL